MFNAAISPGSAPERARPIRRGDSVFLVGREDLRLRGGPYDVLNASERSNIVTIRTERGPIQVNRSALRRNRGPLPGARRRPRADDMVARQVFDDYQDEFADLDADEVDAVADGEAQALIDWFAAQD